MTNPSGTPSPSPIVRPPSSSDPIPFSIVSAASSPSARAASFGTPANSTSVLDRGVESDTDTMTHEEVKQALSQLQGSLSDFMPQELATKVTEGLELTEAEQAHLSTLCNTIAQVKETALGFYNARLKGKEITCPDESLYQKLPVLMPSDRTQERVYEKSDTFKALFERDTAVFPPECLTEKEHSNLINAYSYGPNGDSSKFVHLLKQYIAQVAIQGHAFQIEAALSLFEQTESGMPSHVPWAPSCNRQATLSAYAESHLEIINTALKDRAIERGMLPIETRALFDILEHKDNPRPFTTAQCVRFEAELNDVIHWINYYVQTRLHELQYFQIIQPEPEALLQALTEAGYMKAFGTQVPADKAASGPKKESDIPEEPKYKPELTIFSPCNKRESSTFDLTKKLSETDQAKLQHLLWEAFVTSQVMHQLTAGKLDKELSANIKRDYVVPAPPPPPPVITSPFTRKLNITKSERPANQGDDEESTPTVTASELESVKRRLIKAGTKDQSPKITAAELAAHGTVINELSDFFSRKRTLKATVVRPKSAPSEAGEGFNLAMALKARRKALNKSEGSDDSDESSD